MGEVYRAADTRLGRSVALKFLHTARQEDDTLRARMLREARAASVLQSPHTAAIYDIGEHEGSIFIVMELVEGETLAAKVARGPLSILDSLQIGMQIADALDEAHANGVLHRDIKSANVMVDQRGRVKVLDFGLAKFIDGEGGKYDAQTLSRDLETGTGLVLGTISYMSPEQALGRRLDFRSDLFSLGVVLYELLAGRRPFDAESSTEVLDQLLHHEPPALARFNYDIPPRLEAIVVKTLAKDASYRYQSARELYIDLHGVRQDEEVARRGVSSSASHVVGSPTTSTSARPSPASTVPVRRPAVAVMTFTNITSEPADDWIGSGIAETVTADLKELEGVSVIGRAQIFGELKQLGDGRLDRLDDSVTLDVGRRLGASWIVGGAYQRLGAAIRITAQFIEVESGTLLKTVKVDGKTDHIFELQDKIVYELGQGLNLQLDDSAIRRIEKRDTESMEAYEAYSHGMMNIRMASHESIERAIHLFEKAIEHDANYASAWAALGMAYSLKGTFLSLRDLQLKGVDAMERALSLDPAHSDASYWLAMALTSLGEVDRAIETSKRALAINPNNDAAHAGLARAYWIGRGDLDKGIEELECVVALDPSAGYAYLQLALLYALRGQYSEAEQAATRSVALQQRSLGGSEGLQILGAHVRLGYVYYRQGRYDEAITEYERGTTFLDATDHALRERTQIEAHQKLSAAYFRKGDLARANEYLELAVKAVKERLANAASDGSTLYYVASLYGLRGDVPHALKYLSASFEQLPALNRVRASLDPDFDPIRDEPEFVDVLEELEEE